MDSLLVLRRPLKKGKSEPQFIKPVKPTKNSPRAPLKPQELVADKGQEEPLTPEISFVKLYNELCSTKQSDRAARRVKSANSSTKITDDSLKTAKSKLLSESADSVLKTSTRDAKKPNIYPKYKRAPRTEVVLEMDYGKEVAA